MAATLKTLTARTADFGATLRPFRGIRNRIPYIGFSDAADQGCYWNDVMPDEFSGEDLIVAIQFMHVATSGNVVIAAAIERHDSSTDIDTASFDTEETVTTAVPATSGVIKTALITLATGEFDGLVAGEQFNLRLRVLGTDGAHTASGNTQITSVRLYQTASLIGDQTDVLYVNTVPATSMGFDVTSGTLSVDNQAVDLKVTGEFNTGNNLRLTVGGEVIFSNIQPFDSSVYPWNLHITIFRKSNTQIAVTALLSCDANLGGVTGRENVNEAYELVNVSALDANDFAVLVDYDSADATRRVSTMLARKVGGESAGGGGGGGGGGVTVVTNEGQGSLYVYALPPALAGGESILLWVENANGISATADGSDIIQIPGYEGSEARCLIAGNSLVLSPVLDGIWGVQSVFGTWLVSTGFPLPSGAQGIWNFEDDLLDSKNDYDLTAVGSPTYGTGKVGAKGINLGGTAYLTRSGVDDAVFDMSGSDFTILVWVYRTAASSGFQAIVCKDVGGGGGWRWYLLEGLYLPVPNVYVVGPSGALTDLNTWTHIGVRRSGNTWTLWKNGAINNTGTNANTGGNATGQLTVARLSDLTNHPMPAGTRYDQLAIFTAAVSDSEIADIYNGGTGRELTGTEIS